MLALLIYPANFKLHTQLILSFLYAYALPRSTYTEQFFNLPGIGRIHDGKMLQVSLLLFGLLRQNMTVISVLSLDFTRSGKNKSFFSTGVRFDLWHLL